MALQTSKSVAAASAKVVPRALPNALLRASAVQVIDMKWPNRRTKTASDESSYRERTESSLSNFFHILPHTVLGVSKLLASYGGILVVPKLATDVSPRAVDADFNCTRAGVGGTVRRH